MKTRLCQWCSAEFETKHPSKLFCCTAHKIEFNNYMTVVGRKLAPIALAWRTSRGRAGVGSQALKEMTRMLDETAADLTKRGAQPIAKHFKHCRADGVGVTLAADR